MIEEAGSYSLTLPSSWIIEVEVTLVENKRGVSSTMPVLISGSDICIELDGIIDTRKKVEQLVGRIEGAVAKIVNRKIDRGEIGVRP